MTDIHTLTPAMSDIRLQTLTKALNESNIYLEFGMGGSTILAARSNIQHIVSVDSSQEWIEKVTKQLNEFELKGQVQLLHANLGSTGAWGYPLDGKLIHNWPSYYCGPWRSLRIANLSPDLVLIDGRLRVACFLYSLIHLKSGSTILWDDYTPRPEYHVVESILEPHAIYDGMAEFKVTGNEDIRTVVDMLFHGMYILD